MKNGDGAADFKPIAHLYKSQVYELADFLAIPDAIRSRPPTTDTYSLEQSQEESVSQSHQPNEQKALAYAREDRH